MLIFFLALALLGVALFALDVRKVYVLIPAKELKRQARAHDPMAQLLYRAAAYGASLRAFLGIVIVLAAAGSFVLLAQIAPAWLAFIAVAAALAYGFAWMPSGHVSKFGLQLAAWAAPTLSWILLKIHPLFDRVLSFIQAHRPITVHTGLYDRDDLLQLIVLQKQQPDSRISPETLDLLAHTLTFGDKIVRDCMVPRRMVRMVSTDEPIGPVLMRELHDSGFSRFPVYQDKPEQLVGTLYLRDLVNVKHTGKVGGHMQPRVYYVHEEYPLEQVLDAFLKTQHHLFIVVNSFEEFVGIITIEDILEQILGCKIVDEFDHYDDLRAVARHHAHTEHERHEKQGSEAATTAADPENPYPPDTIKHILYQAGFRDEPLEIAYAVALAESAGNPEAHNDTAATGDDSYGLFQINMLGDMGAERRAQYKLRANDDLFDPLTNVRVAYELSEHGQNWQPWSAFIQGTHQQFLDAKANISLPSSTRKASKDAEV